MARAAERGGVVWSPERRPWGPGDVLALAAYLAAVVWVFREPLLGGRALFYFDISEINYPYRDFLASEWKAGRFSRWHPGLYCGMALFSESQAGYFHPLKFLYLFLPTWRAFNLDTVLSVALTGLATYGWLRRHVGAAGALTGAAVFSLGGFLWAHLVHTSMINALIGVPLAIWALECAWDGGRLRGAALGALALASQVFAGHLQDTLLTATALGLYGLYRAATEQRIAGRAFALGSTLALVGLGVAVAAVQWVPSKELIDRSPRAEGIPWEDLTYGSWHPELLPTLLVREAYGTRARDTDWMDGFYPYHEMNAYLGAIALAMAVIGGAAYRDRWVGFWVLLAGLALLMMLGRFTFLMDRMTDVPFLGRGRIPVRYHLWLSLAVAALAGVGVDRLSRPGLVRIRGGFSFVLALILLSLPILAWVYEPTWTERRRWTSPYNLKQFDWLGDEMAWGVARMAALLAAAWVVSAIAARWMSPVGRGVVAGLIPALVMVELLAAHSRDVPTVTPDYWTEPPASAVWLRSRPDLIRVEGFQERSLAEPGYASGSYAFFEDKFFKARETLAYSLAPVWDVKMATGVTPIVPTRFLAYCDNVGLGRFDVESVSHMISTREAVPGLPSPEAVGSVFVYRNPNVLPRARLMGRPVNAEGRKEASRALKSLGSEVRSRLVVEDPDRPLAESAEVSGTATIVADLPERVEVDARAETPAYLFLADTFDPGWSATVDGRPAPIRPAQVNFRAVFVPAGEHRVVFTYEPAGFRTGLAITGAGLAACLVGLIWPRRWATLSPTHGPTAWLRGWPWMLLGLMVAVVAISAVVRDPAGRPRWANSWHRFTWSAGIEAMKPPPPPVE